MQLGWGDNHQVQNFNTPIWELVNTINTRLLTPKVTLYLEINPPPLENLKKGTFLPIPPGMHKLFLLFVYMLLNKYFQTYLGINKHYT